MAKGKSKTQKKSAASPDLVRNRKASHDFEILESFDAGLVLMGTEVKSLREKKASLAESYIRIEGRELWWIKGQIDEYPQGNVHNHEPLRKRKLLLKKREILKLLSKVREKGLTLVPLGIYANERGFLKLRFGLCRGKKRYDKREAERKKSARREIRTHD